jgi:hypothetical protein
VIEHDESLGFVGRERLFGRGIGWIDVHLLASARISHLSLRTLDRRLLDTAGALGIAA